VDLKVKVWSGRVAGGADPGNDLPGRHGLSCVDGQLGGVAVYGRHSTGVQENHPISFSALDLGNRPFG
jgi:hypothetical protein